MATRGYGKPRACPVPITALVPTTCGAVTRAGHLMCPAHWRLVPKALRDDVWATWRTWQRDMTDDHWQAYLAARTAALESL